MVNLPTGRQVVNSQYDRFSRFTTDDKTIKKIEWQKQNFHDY